MNRKIMDGLSYGFYFIIVVLIFLIVYLIFFKSSTPKQNNSSSGEEENNNSVINENIKLNKSEITLDIGESFSLKVSLVPSSGTEIITFASSNEQVATVDESGKIMGIGAGSATILVTVEGTDLKSECQVIVSDNIIKATGLFVNNEQIQINNGENYQLEVTIIPNNTVDKTLIFSSNNEAIASVDENGLITALKPGKTKILITAQSNELVNLEIDVIVK